MLVDIPIAHYHRRMLTKVIALAFACAAVLSIVACGEEEHTSSSTSDTDVPEIYSHLRKPGMITHVRYTTYTPPWPTRTEAWIDWDNNRIRSWNVQWTDSPTNPFVCTSIRDDRDWYPCLPSLQTLSASETSAGFFFSPTIPLRRSESGLSVGGSYEALMPLKLQNEVVTRAQTQGGVDAVVTSWEVPSGIDIPCSDGENGETFFEYTATESGEPISEFVSVDCEAQRQQFLGVIYHDIKFVDPSDLPSNFFDADSTRTALLKDQLSSAAAQLGSVFWLGERVDDWELVGVDPRPELTTIGYSRADGEDTELVSLMTRSPSSGRICENPEPLPGDAFGGSLCRYDTTGERYGVVWSPPGFDVWLEIDSWPEELARADVLALAASIEEWTQRASGPLLTPDAVRDLVADSLEIVCPSAVRQIRTARQESSSFTFDRQTGEWTGVFGTLGDYAVPDAKPVAIPVTQREAVESTLSHNAAQFAECTFDEYPPPEDGDDAFAVEFLEQSDAGLRFEVTGVDPQIDAALLFCTLDEDAGCKLTAPDGASVATGPIEINPVRPQVLSIRFGIAPDDLRRTGTWTLTLDLGDGLEASTTFDVD